MLPCTALRSGTFGRVLFSRVNSHALATRALSTTTQQTQSAAVTEAKDPYENIKKAHEYFNSPDRDYVNFPSPVQPETCPPVRLGFIPESFFNAFYDKTGVTGPYLFGTGLIATLISKEIWVVDHGFTEVFAFATAVTLVVKKLGPWLSEQADKVNEYREEILFKKPIRDAKKSDEAFIAKAHETIAAQDGQKYLYEAKRENVDLQLEAEYRRRLSEAYQAVKNRLDHQLDTQNAKIRFQQEHMVKWIVDNVVKSITPQQEQESIKKCLSDLKAMAARA